MKNILISILILVAKPPQGIYSIRIKDIDGGVKQLSAYYGKKMVFLILSGKESDSALNNLARFCSHYKDSAVIIGILSVEDGYDEANKDSVKKLFKGRAPGLVLTGGMYTRKSSASQSEIMQWLTHVEMNRRFGYDITGPGWKFFFDEWGELYAALSPFTQLSSATVQRVMNRPAKRVTTPPVPQKTP